MNRDGHHMFGTIELLQRGRHVGCRWTVDALLPRKILDEHILARLGDNRPNKAFVAVYLVAGCKATCGHGHAKYDMMEFHCVCFC